MLLGLLFLLVYLGDKASAFKKKIFFMNESFKNLFVLNVDIIIYLYCWYWNNQNRNVVVVIVVAFVD